MQQAPSQGMTSAGPTLQQRTAALAGYKLVWVAQAAGGRLEAAGPARRLTLLFLHNALLARTAAALGAPKLASLLLPLVASDCPHMQCAAAHPSLPNSSSTKTLAHALSCPAAAPHHTFSVLAPRFACMQRVHRVQRVTQIWCKEPGACMRAG